MTAFEFPLPDLGEGLTEARLIDWCVEAGDEVAEDEPLAEVETDKAVVEVPSPCTGTVARLLADVGDEVAVGAALAVLDCDDPPARYEPVADSGASAASPADGGPPAATDDGGADDATGDDDSDDHPAGGADEGTADDSDDGAETDRPAPGGRIFAAPSTRRYARERGVDLSAVRGTGPGGRILRADVDSHGARDGDAATGGPSSDADAPAGTDSRTDERVTRRPLSGIRKRIAENMVRSKSTIPHVTQGFVADATELVALKERLDGTHDRRITYTPILLKAVVPALKEFPIVNASVDDEADEVVEKHYYNVGVATHTPDGLVVPVIRDVDAKSILEIAAELETLVAAARDGALDVADLRDGTFTVTNVGSRSEHRTFGTPIIAHPQAAILGVGRIRDEPVAVGPDAVEVRPRLDLSFSFDHRIIDGVTATEFVESVVAMIEDTDVLVGRL